ncbi:MAG: type II secretion system protein GspD, partial [Bdellovibrionaceae bacterium]|nr:type II secretion system protein GspD [Pseudobdellovibrionaceae bacterium]
MTFQRKVFSTVLATSFLMTQTLRAQMDDSPVPPPIEDFSAPTTDIDDFGGLPTGLPAPPEGAAATGGADTVIKADPNAKPGILNKNQRGKFARANPEDITAENFPETIESFDFPNVEITDVIRAISELTGKNFIIDSTVRGKITILAPSKITVAEAYKAFLSALAINGFTVVPSGGFLKIRNARSAQRDSIDTYSGAYY